jgi:protein SCO1
MTDKKPFPTTIVWLAILAIILLFAGLFLIKQMTLNKSQIPILGQLPDFNFVESGGQKFGLSELKGKINVVDFMFTSCPVLCPVMSEKMAQLYRDYSDNPQIRFVSITVDPETDSLPVLRDYAKAHGVNDNRWVFLRGPISDVIALSEKGFMLAADRLPGGHSTRFILVDTQGGIRGYYDSSDDSSLAKLRNDIQSLRANK